MSDFDTFEYFEQKFGEGERYDSVSPSRLENIQSSGLPNFFVEHIKMKGLRQYGNGLWWLLDPLALEEDVAALADLKSPLPVLRSSFGCFIAGAHGEYYSINPHSGSCRSVGKDLGLFMNATLTDDYALHDMYFLYQHQHAEEHLGRLLSDEMYTFVPALRLGGSRNYEAIHRVKMREQLSFLAQLER